MTDQPDGDGVADHDVVADLARPDVHAPVVPEAQAPSDLDVASDGSSTTLRNLTADQRAKHRLRFLAFLRLFLTLLSTLRRECQRRRQLSVSVGSMFDVGGRVVVGLSRENDQIVAPQRIERQNGRQRASRQLSPARRTAEGELLQ